MQEDALTQKVLQVFEQISAIPRCSKNEAQITQWLIEWAQRHDFVHQTDAVGNLLVRVPATPGYENAPIIVLQGHLDMVCEKTPDADHDFTKDPIKLIRDGEWIHADKTSLGADNGIAIAMAMVVATATDIAHPPLELLFTIDEETGLTGANALQAGFIAGRILLNLDSEDEGYFTVGCAGGRDTRITVPIGRSSLPASWRTVRIAVGGLRGGHSGVDIKLGRANAIKLLARALRNLLSALPELMLVDIKGGSAHNAIPRDGELVVALPAPAVERLEAVAAELDATFRAEYKRLEPNLQLRWEVLPEAPETACDRSSSERTADFLLALPHGVACMSPDIADLVETSNNLALLSLDGNKLRVLTSQRSSVMSRLDAITSRIEATTRLAGGVAISGTGYPAWQPNMDSPLLARCVELYRKQSGKDPVVEVIHAGLECGIIGAKNPGMDMISFGPTIKFPHSPEEKLHVVAVTQVCHFLNALLASYGPC